MYRAVVANGRAAHATPPCFFAVVRSLWNPAGWWRDAWPSPSEGRRWMRAMIPIGDGLDLDERDLEESFIRASGPGGQNVNKVASAVQLRFDLRQSRSF